jgi:hypothetical protein
MLVPKNAKELNDPRYVQASLTMAKVINETIDSSVAPEQDKLAAKA